MLKRNMDAKYTFQYMENKDYKSLKDKDTKEFLMKWSMKGNFKIQTYSFNESFQSYQKQDFANEFFKSEVVKTTLHGLLGVSVASVDVQQISCSILTMTFFDRLTDPSNGIVQNDKDSLVKCYHEEFDNFNIEDEMRKMLLDNESENYSMYSETERNQFLFRLFQHLCLGGQWCQFEDKIKPYFVTVRKIYRDIISVQRDPSTQDICITSVVLQVVVKGCDGKPCLPKDPYNIQNFIYLIVNPINRQVIALMHDYGGAFYA